jgi:DNA-binding NarL/FixJ family response regulator
VEAQAHAVNRIPKRVLIADPNEVYRAGVKAVLADREWVEVVGEVGDEEELASVFEATRPDMVVIDPGIAADGDDEVIARVRCLDPDVKVVAVTGSPNGQIKRIIQSGANGCLLKGAGSDELAAALRLVAEGRHYIQADLVGPMLAGEAPDGGPIRLSSQQLEILRLVSRGLKNKQIARNLGISLTALKTHLRLIYARFDASNRVEAVAAAIRLGIVN